MRHRVAHVITRLVVGGAQENTIASAVGLQAKGDWDVSLISGPTLGPEGSLEDRMPGTGVDFHVATGLVRNVSPADEARAFVWLWRHFREQSPTIVHTHSAKAGILGRLAARMARVPIIIHSLHGPSFGDFQGAAANVLYKNAERLAGRVTDHYISVADAMSQRHLSAGIGNPEDYTRVFSGFDIDPYLRLSPEPQGRERWGLGKDDFVIAKVARMFQLKGHDDLFDIAPDLVRRIPNAKFLLIGGGEWEAKFRQRAQDLDLEDRFVFTGLVPPESIPELLGASDVLVHLSYREGLPRALPQAMAAARPMVAYDNDGAPEVCRPGETGELAPCGDALSALEGLCRIAADRPRARAMGVAGREFVRERFSITNLVDQQNAVYRQLLQRKGISPTPETA